LRDHPDFLRARANQLVAVACGPRPKRRVELERRRPWLPVIVRGVPVIHSPSAAHRELGKHWSTAYRPALTQVRGHGDWLLLTVGDRCEPLLGARRGHGRRG
jgi:hypothetical protein